MSKDYKGYKNDAFFNPKATNLHSSVQDKGRFVSQIITFKGGYKKTIRGVDTTSLMQSEFTHFNTKDGRKVMVYTPNVFMVEVFGED